MAKPRSNSLRLIGGEFGGRRLHFPNVAGLRPTADRVRETLFNWLAPDIQGARCLDLFAGSGALGLEALSRGAARVDFVEKARAAAASLREHLSTLGCEDRGSVTQQDARAWLRGQAGSPGSYDVIFLDPPFAAGLMGQLWHALASAGLLAEKGALYAEQDSSHQWPVAPAAWRLHREGRAGQAAYRLYRLGD